MPVEGESKVRQQIIKQKRCRLSIIWKTWFTELMCSGKWNYFLIRAGHWSIKPMSLAVFGWCCCLFVCFCRGGNYHLSVRGPHLIWTKDNNKAWCAGASESCSWMGVIATSLGLKWQMVAFSFTPSEWPPWRQINRSDRGRESHVAELSASQKGEFNSSVLWTEPRVSLSES